MSGGRSFSTRALFRIDIPFMAEHEMNLMREAGFCEAQKVWHRANTAVITAKKAY